MPRHAATRCCHADAAAVHGSASRAAAFAAASQRRRRRCRAFAAIALVFAPLLPPEIATFRCRRRRARLRRDVFHAAPAAGVACLRLFLFSPRHFLTPSLRTLRFLLPAARRDEIAISDAAYYC